MKIKFAVMALTAGLLGSAASAQVLTADLPSNTYIVNVSGTQYGAGASSGSPFGSQSFWYQPFFTGGATSLLSLTLAPGTYSFTLVDPHDASVLYPSLTSGDLSQIFTSWTYNSPFTTSYLVFNSTAASNPSEHQLFSGGNFAGTFYFSAQASYDAMVAAGDASQLQTGAAGGRDDLATFQTSYTFASTTTLDFAVPDSGLFDNGGGVSILVRNLAPTVPSGLVPVPEPSTYGFIGAALLGGLVAVRRRKLKTEAAAVKAL
jgi:PEP-CTERM motif